jgi:NAD(P)-dependent dehydrogenase (short-subunit alcohol dehydrogenase family)
MSSQPRAWFITGASSGFGKEFVYAILARGDKVIATARNPAKLEKTDAHNMKLDVTAPPSEIQKFAEEAVAVYGRIDVVINSAGYFQMGTVEETTPEQTMTQFNTNVFGTMNVTRAFLPYLRRQRSGTIVNFGSVGGWRGFPLCALYSASKFAVAGFTLALKPELEPFGIEVTVVEPGYFATSFLEPQHVLPTTGGHIDDYAEFRENMFNRFNQTSGKQPGDPVKGVQRVIEAVTHSGYADGKKLPGRLILGRDAYGFVGQAMKQWEEDRQDWKDWTFDSWRDDVPLPEEDVTNIPR